MLRFFILFFFMATIGAAAAACGASDEGPLAPPTDAGANADAASPKDGGAPSDAVASACSPANVGAFEPVWLEAEPFGQGLCSPSQLESFALACAGSDSARYSSACAAFRNGADLDCAACIFTAPRKPTEGPLVSSGAGHFLLNRAGCLANVTGDATRSGCAAMHQALAQCESAACAANCPVTDQSGEAFAACAVEARANVCNVYVAGVEECSAAIRADGGVGAIACLDGDAVDLARLFCGAPPAAALE